MKQNFLMLAHKYDPKKHNIVGWFVSEKLDGIRCFWDGGISRYKPTSTVPWANTAKDYRFVNEQISTGLWSRYGHVIYAPDWWIDMLPNFCLDGELYNMEGWQETSKIVKRHDRNGDWGKVKYYVFDRPNWRSVFGDREINEINYTKNFSGIKDWIKDVCIDFKGDINKELRREDQLFEYNYKFLRDYVEWNEHVVLHEQKVIKNNDELDKMMSKVLEKGGEGLIVRNNYSVWTPERSKSMLKMKGMNDAEGTVVGYRAGIGKLKGLMGSLVLDYKGKRFDLSGFTDLERRLNKEVWGEEPGAILGDEYWSELFPRGSVVTFKYRSLSDNLLPKEASYLRKNV